MIIPSGINERLLMRAITDFHAEIEIQRGISSSPISIVKEDFYCFTTEDRVMVIGRTIEDGWTHPWCIFDLKNVSVDGIIVEIDHAWETAPNAEARVSAYQYHQDFTDVSDYGRMVLSTFMI